MIKNLFCKKKGLSGISHILFALVIFQLIWIVPIFSKSIGKITARGFMNIIIFWGIVLGGSLIPDLDNQESTAGYQLGILGKIMTMFAVMTSGVIYSATRTRKDHCKSQHRMFWHTPLSSILGILVVTLFIPESNVTIFGYVREVMSTKSMSFNGVNPSSMSIAIVFYILSCASFYLSINVICYRASKIFARKFFSTVKSITPLVSIIYLGIYAPISYLRITGVAVCVGVILHIIGDLFSLGSVPLFFPLKIKGQRWYKPKIPFQIETGGMINQIFNFALAIASVGLFLVMFKIK